MPTPPDAAAGAPAPLRALVVDDEKNIRTTLAVCLEGLGCKVLQAANGTAALEALRMEPFELAFCDLRLGQESGLELLPRLLAERPELEVVFITAYATVDTAVEAMRGRVHRGRGGPGPPGGDRAQDDPLRVPGLPRGAAGHPRQGGGAGDLRRGDGAPRRRRGPQARGDGGLPARGAGLHGRHGRPARRHQPRTRCGGWIASSSMKEYDLVERGLCWQPDIVTRPEFMEFVREVKSEFRNL